VATDQYALRRDARRFETWENAYALRAGLGAAFDYADAIGIGAIEARVKALAAQCRGLLSDNRKIRLHDIGTDQCGIISFSVDTVEADEIVQKMAAAGFILGASTPASTRLDAERRNLPTVVRMAPHYYNSEDEIKACVAQISRLL
jgi:selenocysteine lyase/cysteine desulfurase